MAGIKFLINSNSRIKALLVFICCFLFPSQISLAQNTGGLYGTIKDSTSSEVIFGANIFILDLFKGTATGENGSYEINNIPTGRYQIRFSYIGYIQKVITVEIEPNTRKELNIKLQPEIYEGEEITVLAQAAGQVAAIKQQIESNTIVNVVSKERLGELPDQNAAESVARLPGVSVQRDAGEASKVVVRGLSPRFNSITVNGIKLPGSGDDRSVDLSLVPSEVLGGIEVFKALTPDKDGDAVGGTVNLLVRKAPNDFRGSVSAETGYNDLRNEFGQYKFSLNLSDRFLDDKLGVLVSGNIQRTNRSSELFDNNLLVNQADSSLRTENLNLADTRETRDKYGFSASLDYKLDENNEIFFSSLLGRTDRDEQRYRKRYRVGNTRTEYDLQDRNRFESVYSNSLSGRHNWDFIEVDWQSSYSNSLSKTPYSNYSRFIEIGAFRNGLDDTNADSIVAAANNDLDETYFQYGTFNTSRRTEGDFTAALNTQINFNITNNIDGYLKFGGKYRDKNKFVDQNENRTDFEVVSQIGQDNPDDFELYNSTHIAISNFINSNYNTPSISGRYQISPGLDANALGDFYDRFSNYYEKNRVTDLRDYEAGESITAFYGMMEFNFGQRVTLLPGLRYEYTENFYDGKFGNLNGNLGQAGVISDTTGGQSYGELLPQVHLKVNILEGVDLRLAYTESISRPNYDNLVPFQNVNDPEQTLSRGNPDLKHTSAVNYDVFLSFYKNSIGYLSVGLFYKELENIDYIRTTRLQEGEFSGYELTSPVNAEGTSTVKGIEIDFQTDFRFLPKPLNGLILSTNIAFIKSETFFPVFKIGPRSPDPPFRPTIIDTVRSGKLPGQPDVTASFTLGYEIGLFSARASLAYQQDILNEIASTSLGDGLSEGFSFWDFRLNQSFKSAPNLTFFFNVNNILSENEKDFIGSGDISKKSRDFSYGLTASTGIKVKF
jgi:TonB-dependent receptor